jgi:hypothetical protein
MTDEKIRASPSTSATLYKLGTKKKVMMVIFGLFVKI